MGKLRHIAYRVDDPEAMAEFFVNGLGMTYVQKRSVAIDLTDGTINITLLPSTEGSHGIDHIGFTVEDEDAAQGQLLEAGATPITRLDLGSVNYEVKFRGPEGIVVDLGHWAGTEPIAEA
jgi:catechol 2,3-dioxygenase-like lactoylglutathione lyase family enzyme